jgi:peptidoglycan hydrolase CwlO-like protein
VVISRRFRLALVVSLFATLLLLAVPSIASASALAATKAQARTAAAQVAGLDRQLNQTVATYAAAMQRLTALQSQVAANRAALRLDSYQLTLSRQQLAENLVSAYKGGGASVLNAVFETGSFDDLLTRLDYVQQLTGSNAALVGAVQQHHRQVVAEQATLSKALKSAQQTATQLDAQRGRLNAQLGARRALLRGLNAAVGRLVRQAKAVTPVVTSSKTSGAAPSTAGDGSGPWWTLIQSAAAGNGLWAEGLYRLMLAESGGSATASNGVDDGLFQYAPGTWKGSWNPWRSASIFDGGAQIRATALAIHLGYGPSWWPSTYPWAFSRQ